MKNRALRLCGAVLILLVAGIVWPGSTAFARNEKGSWEVGVYVLQSLYDNESGINDTTGGGVRGAYHFKAVHALEIDFDWSQGEARLVPGVDIDVFKYSVSYLHNHFIRGHEKVLAHSTFGVGLLDLDDGMQDADSSFFRVGGGFKYWFNDHAGIRFDGKIYHWRGDNTVAPRNGYFSFDLTLGATFLFGGAE